LVEDDIMQAAISNKVKILQRRGDVIENTPAVT
jgi:hypothetical protein